MIDVTGTVREGIDASGALPVPLEYTIQTTIAAYDGYSDEYGTSYGHT